MRLFASRTQFHPDLTVIISRQQLELSEPLAPTNLFGCALVLGFAPLVGLQRPQHGSVGGLFGRMVLLVLIGRSSGFQRAPESQQHILLVVMFANRASLSAVSSRHVSPRKKKPPQKTKIQVFSAGLMFTAAVRSPTWTTERFHLQRITCRQLKNKKQKRG